MNKFLMCCCVVWILALAGCAKTQDLDAPCPDYGRYCSQIPANAWGNDEI
ncbi:MAG: hypothetical protein H0U75_10055 [Legionella sp.]|nr:hypothetical protein [Legionella sp.]